MKILWKKVGNTIGYFITHKEGWESNINSCLALIVVELDIRRVTRKVKGRIRSLDIHP